MRKVLLYFSFLMAHFPAHSIELPVFIGDPCIKDLTAQGSPREILYAKVLADEPGRLNSSSIVEFLYEHPQLSDLGIREAYDGSAGVTEGYTLREHTRMVLTVFREQAKFYRFAPEDYRGVNVGKLLQFVIAIHDLGKGLSLQAYEDQLGRAAETKAEFKAASARQSEYTMPLVRKLLQIFEFPEAESALAITLIDGDIMGAVVTGKIKAEEGHRQITEAAEKLGVTPAALFNLKLLYFVSDAASYPGLRYGRGLSARALPPVFVEQAGGQLLPRAQAFQDLLEMFRR